MWSGAFISVIQVGSVINSLKSKHLGLFSTSGSVGIVLGTVTFLIKSVTEKKYFKDNNIYNNGYSDT